MSIGQEVYFCINTYTKDPHFFQVIAPLFSGYRIFGDFFLKVIGHLWQ